MNNSLSTYVTATKYLSCMNKMGSMKQASHFNFANMFYWLNIMFASRIYNNTSQPLCMRAPFTILK